MEDKLRQQLAKILEKAEAEEEDRTIKFFEQTKSIELEPEEDRTWLMKQFRVLAKLLKWTVEEKRQANWFFTMTVFTMGRAYERYYAHKRGYNGGE